MEYNDNSSRPEKFVPNDAPHSENKEQPNKGMYILDKFEVIKYSVGDNKEFLGIHTLKRDSWAQNVNGISSIYLDIFRKKDEGKAEVQIARASSKLSCRTLLKTEST
ncbi:hypothetical protein Tco_1565891 [Tanacetum coccineum]